MNRIFVFPWDQLSEGATAVAAALDTQKLLRKGSRYRAQDGDVLVNWGASDFNSWFGPRSRDTVLTLNADVSVTIDKRIFFDRCEGMYAVPRSITIKRQPDRLDMARSMIDLGCLSYPVLCRVKVKGKDGEGIVIARSSKELVDAPLYVQLEEKSAEYRVHVGRNRDGSLAIIGVQQKFLPKGTKKEDCTLRTTSSGCYFVWTKDGEPVKVPEPVRAAALEVFERFPELTFGGLDVIYDLGRDRAFVIEINSAPEMTEKSAELYAAFFQQFREDRPWAPHLDYAGEPMAEGQFRDPEPVIERQAEDAALDAPLSQFEPNEDYVARNLGMAVALLEAAGVQRLGWQRDHNRIDVV